MLELRDKFIENGIPYDNIDPEMIELLDVLNFDLGLKTQFCCYGHTDIDGESYVVFDKSVTDEQIYHLAEQVGKEYGKLFIAFNKWVRLCPVLSNWVFKIAITFKDHAGEKKQEHMNKVVSFLRECEKRTT